MNYGTIPGIDREISQLVLGCMLFTPDTMEHSYSMLDEFFAAGGNALDTAHSYGGGDSERLLVVDEKSQKQIRGVLVDKGGHPHAAVPVRA